MKAIILFALFAVSQASHSSLAQPKVVIVQPVIPSQASASAGVPLYVPKENQEDVEQVTAAVMETLRKEIGAQTGTYYVYFPDGRLQKVEYTTAPLKAPEGRDGKEVSAATAQAQGEQARLEQVSPKFYYFKDAEGRYAKLTVPAEKADDAARAKPEAVKESAAGDAQVKGYVASVQYTDVDPIKAPVYSYNPAPLVRIVRYAPVY